MKIRKGDIRKAVITYVNLFGTEHKKLEIVEVISVRGIIFKEYLIKVGNGDVCWIGKDVFLKD